MQRFRKAHDCEAKFSAFYSLASLVLLAVFTLSNPTFLLADGHDGADSTIAVEGSEEATEESSSKAEGKGSYNPTPKVMHHISDANDFHLWGDVAIPLPDILKEKGGGFKMMLSSAFHHGHTAIDGYVLDYGRVKKVASPQLPDGKVDLEVEKHYANGEKHYTYHYNGEQLELEGRYIWVTNPEGKFYDFSITKNVFSMLVVAFIMLVVFLTSCLRISQKTGTGTKRLAKLF